MIKPQMDSILTLPIHEHLIVTLNPQDDKTLIIIGILTSEKNSAIELSKTQPLSGNEHKSQNFRLFRENRIISKEKFQFHKEGTEYIRQPEISEKIIKVLHDAPQPRNLVPYNNESVTVEKLKEMIQIAENEK